MKKKEISLEYALELLGAKDLPDSPQELEELRRMVSRSVEEKGEAWVKKYPQLLLDLWELQQGRLGAS